MKTPICDFVEAYAKSGSVRLHMPGHKGNGLLGFEKFDITEINGADSLFEATGIIAESEKNASSLFGCNSFYSTEGSSLSIRAMLYLFKLWAGEGGRVIAAKNCHKAFLSGAALLDLDIEWIYPKAGFNYLSCQIDLAELEARLSASDRKTAVYITSPDYLGGRQDLKSISLICKKYGAKLLVDNAHGAYLKFLPESAHPMDYGASMCCDSAHKTLPVATGGAYLHIAKDEGFFIKRAKDALSLFGSTSPSYLILQSLDKANEYLENGYCERLKAATERVFEAYKEIKGLGFEIYCNEPLKFSIMPKEYGYYGFEVGAALESLGIFPEFSDKDFLVLMFTPENSQKDFERLISALKGLERKTPITEKPPFVGMPKAVLSLRDALFAKTERISTKNSLGKTYAGFGLTCPPAVPIAVGGEVIDEKIIKCFEYYGIEECLVIKK